MIVQYQFRGWTEHHFAKVSDFYSFFSEVLKAKGLMDANSKVMVHDK